MNDYLKQQSILLGKVLLIFAAVYFLIYLSLSVIEVSIWYFGKNQKDFLTKFENLSKSETQESVVEKLGAFHYQDNGEKIVNWATCAEKLEKAAVSEFYYWHNSIFLFHSYHYFLGFESGKLTYKCVVEDYFD